MIEEYIYIYILNIYIKKKKKQLHKNMFENYLYPYTRWNIRHFIIHEEK